MCELTKLREVADAFGNGPEYDQIMTLLEKIDGGNFDITSESDLKCAKTILTKCTHIRGYQDYFIEKYDLAEWGDLLDEAANEIRSIMNEHS